jgi:LCP family protein required for cell wall assembly
MNDERQSRLLADFLAALQADAHAVPPADLDSDLAAMAQLLVTAKTPPPDAATRERVWQRALAANQNTRVRANGRTPHLSDKENTMTTLVRPVPRGQTTHPFTLAAALAIMAMATLLLFSRPPSNSGSDLPGMLSNPEQQDATATPLATFVPTLTATPFPMAGIDATATSTPLAAVIVSPTATPLATLVPGAMSTATPVPQQSAPTLVPSGGAAGRGGMTLLLMGIDQRPGVEDNQQAYRTDSLIVVNIDPTGKQAAILAIPRDLLVSIPGFGEAERINTANFLGELNAYPGGGPALAAATVERNLGIHIDHYVLVNFDAFLSVANVLAPNGTEVCIDRPIEDPNYPDNAYGFIQVEFAEGCQRLDAERLLQYARIRHSDGDFDRSRRQLDIIRALFQEATQTGSITHALSQLPTLWETLSGAFRTDLSLDQLVSLANLAAQMDPANIRFEQIGENEVWPVVDSEGTWMLAPNYAAIRELVDSIFVTSNSVAAAPVLTPAVIEHRIQPGETLAYIIQLYGYTDLSVIDEVVALNPTMTSPDRLPDVGSVILIPLPSPVPTPLPATLVPPSTEGMPTLVPPSEAIPTLVPSSEGMPTLVPPFVPSQVPMSGDMTITTDAVLPLATIVPGAAPGTLTLDPAQIPTVVPPDWMMAQPEPITPGDTVTGTLSAAQPQRTYQFTAEVSGPVFARVRSEDLSGLGIGFQVVRATGGGGGGGGGGGDRATTQEISGSQYVYAGDQVTVIVSGLSGQSGSFTLSVQRSAATPIAYGETVNGSIDADQPIAYYSFAGTQGDIVTVHVTGSEGFDTRLTLANTSADYFIANDDDGGPGFDPEIQQLTLPETGEYTLLIEPVLPGGGHFTLALEKATALSLDDGPQQIAFNSKAQPMLSFEGQAGETVQLNVTAIRGSSSARYIAVQVLQNGVLIADISRDFGQLSGATQPAAGSLLASGTVTVPQAGRVDIRLGASTTLDSDESLTVAVEIVPVE